jgi:hypothetical protein
MPITWSDWRDVNQPADHKGCAVYRIRLCNQTGPVRISRFLGTDDDGLLCIGKTIHMDYRRKQFVNSLKDGESAHSEGRLLHFLEKESPLLKFHPKPKYQYSFAKVSSGQESKIEEEQIKAYVRRFGEVPPLNSAIPNRYGRR